MTDIGRRTFTLTAAGALAGAALGASVRVVAQQRQDAAADSLHFIDPELRDGARRVQQMGPSGGFDEKALAAARASAPPSSGPLLPQIPVSQRRTPAGRGLPEVTVYLINSDPKVMRPAILHTHGGGYILGSAKSEVPYLQNMARLLDCVIVTVEYRLAPEATYRDSTEDTYAALRWSYANAAEIGIDRTRIALLGESAGGGHAALLAQKARDRGEVPLVLQGLIYPMLDDRTGSTREVAAPIGTIGWNAASNRFGWRSFLGRDPGGPSMPKGAVPAREVNLAGLAPAFIAVGAVDLFVHENIEYARRLIDANIPTELLVVPAAFHAFDRIVPQARVSEAFDKAKLTAFRRAFSIERVA